MNNQMVSDHESVSATLSGIASHAERVARGLENVAPVAASSATGSIHYLHATASHLALEAELLARSGQPGGEARPTLKALCEKVSEILKSDNELREKFEVGTRFRFVNERLQALLQFLEAVANEETSRRVTEAGASSEEAWVGQPVHVYLYNAQGAILRTWTAMLTPRAFYEYSVNRPVYSEKKEIEDAIAQKPNPVQHAYVTVAVKPEHIIQGEGMIVRVREGSLLIERLVTFTHNGNEYIFEQGELVRKK